jgi:hypothetical protein
MPNCLSDRHRLMACVHVQLYTVVCIRTHPFLTRCGSEYTGWPAGKSIYWIKWIRNANEGFRSRILISQSLLTGIDLLLMAHTPELLAMLWGGIKSPLPASPTRYPRRVTGQSQPGGARMPHRPTHRFSARRCYWRPASCCAQRFLCPRRP